MAPVKIYTRKYCGFCEAAKDLLRRHGAAFTEIDTTGKPDLRTEMIEKAGRWTFPQIFIGAAHVGGCDDLYSLDASGRLGPLLAGEDASA